VAHKSPSGQAFASASAQNKLFIIPVNTQFALFQVSDYKLATLDGAGAAQAESLRKGDEQREGNQRDRADKDVVVVAADGVAEEVAELWEPWMRVVDELLEDEELVDLVYEAQGKRHPKSRMLGRQQTPAEVALRMLILKHVRNWSFDALEREVRMNLA